MRCPLAPSSGAAGRGRQWGLCVITVHALQDDGEGAAVFPFFPGLLLFFSAFWKDLAEFV